MYLFYVDESGSRWVRPEGNTDPYPDDRRYYVLLACGVLEHYWHKFEEYINYHKRRLLQEVNTALALQGASRLGLSDAEVKSTIMRRHKERASLPFWSNIKDEDVKQIAKSLYETLGYFKIDLCAVVIDKEYLHGFFDWEKLHRKSYELLLERIQNLMDDRYPKHKALVIVDGVGDRENLSLITKHNFFVQEGSTSSGLRLDKIVQSPLFVSSHLTNGIQLADVCAYNVYRAFMRSDFEYPYFKEILPFFYRRTYPATTQISGLKVFPPESPCAKATF